MNNNIIIGIFFVLFGYAAMIYFLGGVEAVIELSIISLKVFFVLFYVIFGTWLIKRGMKDKVKK